MLFNSTYLGRELELPAYETVSNGENISIISHAALNDIIYGKLLEEYHISVHFVPVPTNESWHYAFMCSISDIHGRHVESIGEATEATLETPIAQGYPVLMAYKRAFDAAAILYLGLPSKVYSDEQIPNATNAAVTEKSVSPDEDDFDDLDDETPAAASSNSASSAAVNTNIFDDDFDDDIFDDDDDDDGGKTPSTNKSDDADDFDDIDDFDDFDDDLDDDDDDNAEISVNDSKFDRIIAYGALSKNPTRIRDCSRSTLAWVANTMTARTDAERMDKQLCAEFLKLKEGK